MFALDRALAQDIVDRAMAILPYNVNVMDYLGIIIGSGDAGRLSTRHEGAQEVLATRQVVEIDALAAGRLGGVRPGVNLPLMLDHQLIGVLGITGDPEQVRVYGELVKMTAEMLMEQRRQQAGRQWRRQRGEELLARLLWGDCPDSLLEEARHLGLQPQQPRQAVLIGLSEPLDMDHALITRLNDRYPQSWCILREPTLLYWCRPVERERYDDTRLLEQAAAQGWPILRIATADASTSLASLRQACAATLDLLDYARHVLPAQRLLHLHSLRLPVLFWRHRHDWLAQDIAGAITPLYEHPQLLATLDGWFEHSGESQVCAEALGIHRNSLRYRLDKIAEITGCNPYRSADLLRLYLGRHVAPDQPGLCK
ncbi:helix-turn-helix domain-containing protein [Pseudomonas syringae]|nr:helix-turn-helix domain-containing protein [Pseudomonas syringae]MBD8576065.1 helix-turn-helix domain-containing protein [Pseudomonas syringae]MBD8792417.1 helix-turn-helix domain-containing protein [Pseudomonas syringae]MBD8802113.1 helix-turn-helix domain-containing protein [Pseudomonas syringae]MBD8813882.1 helix-turn-helix domain-containing protein [Pseudomonas syringae]